MRIELFVARGDPIAEAARAVIGEAAAAAGAAGTIEAVETIEIASGDEARDRRCLGSPTIRVEGLDVEYGEREPPETTAGERWYSTPEGWRRLPTAGMVGFAIREARARLAGGGGERR